MIRTRYFTWHRRSTDRGAYHTLKVNIADRHELEVTASPTGRSVHIYLDGQPMSVSAVSGTDGEAARALRGTR